MYKLFNLKILTPERQFFDGDVEAVTVCAPDGQLTALAGHIPMVLPLVSSTVKFKKANSEEWTEVANSEGFAQVRHDGVIIYIQACEKPEEIDVIRAQEALHRAEEQLRQQQSMNEYKQTKLALARAMNRLRVSQSRLHYE